MSKQAYKTTAEFVKDAQAKKFRGVVIVDNDCVHAYIGEDMVCNFQDEVPEMVLIAVLKALGATAVRP